MLKLRFTRSEDDPNHCLKVVDDRPLILVPYEDDLFLIGADPLICKSKRELDSIFGIMNYKHVNTLMKPKFKKLCDSDDGHDLGNASKLHKTHTSIDVLSEISSVYMFFQLAC